ncbi:MAG TPA: ABC transporter permease [Pirellulales bacterium]|nr:ABC transporter permease [Pirellulales bacterium]
MTLPLAALAQQKSRTAMTTLGIVFGAFVLAASLSIGQGVQDTIQRESHRTDLLRKINVHPKWLTGDIDSVPEVIDVPGAMSNERRERLRTALRQSQARRQNGSPTIKLSREKLAELAALPHVELVLPVVHESCHALLADKSQPAMVAGARPSDDYLLKRIVAGHGFQTADEASAVVSELLLYRLGLLDEATIEGAIGKTLRLKMSTVHQSPDGFRLFLLKPDGSELSLAEKEIVDKIKDRLPESLDKLDLSPAETAVLRAALGSESKSVREPLSVDVTIVGVARDPDAEEQKTPWDPSRQTAEVILPYQFATDIDFRRPLRQQYGADQVVVIVDSEDHTLEVASAIKEQGFNTYAAAEFVRQQRLMYLLIFAGMTCVATVALLVAALGIANTMLMSVLERTREIGIMKAVGAASAQLQLIFLVEGALLGFVGGLLGLFLAWAASFPGDAWVRSRVSSQLKIDLTGSIFVFPAWLPLVVLAFVVTVTTLAAYYPARRAAKTDPVVALRHE